MTISIGDHTAIQSGHTFVSPQEARFMASKLHALRPEDIGTPSWLEQHQALEALSLQAHIDARSQDTEAVKDALVDTDKISTLVIDLLVSEAWMERALPLLRQHIANTLDPVLSFALVQHESVVAAILEVVLHHGDAAQSLSDEAALELCDWCARKLAYLDRDGRKYAKALATMSPRDILNQTPFEELEEREAELRFSASLSALAILRHITDHVAHLPLAAIHRVASTNNGAAAVVPLLMRPPWERRAAGGKGIERWEGSGWVRLDPQNARRLGTTEAQAWLLLHNLLLHPAAATKLDLGNESLVESLLELRPKLTASLTDQLPGVICGVQRFLEELALGVHRPAASDPGLRAASAAAKVVIEQAPSLRSALLDQTDWKSLAETQKVEQFALSAVKETAQARLDKFLEAIDFMCDTEALDGGQSGILTGALHTAVKMDAYREEEGGQWIWHGTYRYHLRTDSAPETIQVAAAAGPAEQQGDALRAALDPKLNKKEEEVQKMLTGKRYRLSTIVREAGAKALPPRGKLVVSVGNSTCEALLELPAPETRDTAQLPAALWVTVGALASDGLVLQLKVKKVERATERAGGGGEWCAYTPGTGALSVRDDILQDGVGEEVQD